MSSILSGTSPLSDQAQADEAAALTVIVQLVRQSTQIDVSHYKDSTFRRQLQRRMLELDVPDLPQYAAYLQREPDEVRCLQQSLLISVTHFFRDPEVFARLAAVITQVVADKADGEGLRIWVPGCATGEEVYTVAMLVAEALGERQALCPVRLFATDIDQQAIRHARQGLYPLDALGDVPPELVARYFVRDEDGVRPTKFIRDMCVFAHHDLLSQPPFVNLDLISCRNVLIYFQSEIQNEILAKFHHALRPGAWLLLGQSESVGNRDGLYEAQDSHFKLFQRCQVTSPRLHDMGAYGRSTAVRVGVSVPPQVLLPTPESRFHQLLLSRHAPASVLVDANGRVLQLWGDVGRYLQLEGGRADFSLPGLCVPALRGEVRTLMHLATAASDGQAVSRLVEWPVAAVQERLTLSAHAVTAQAQGDLQGVLISFEPRVAPANHAEVHSPRWGSDDVERQTLLDELALSREHLHALVHKLERAHDERQALHEELQASSEELQSSNEELQASNEELTTLNEQLLSKSDELSTLNDMLLSVERSVQMAMVVLDPHMRVQRFNPLAVRIFGLLEHDVGRPLSSVPCSLPLYELPQQIAQVLATGVAQVSRVDQADRHYVMQISPLHDAREVLAGVILSFTDVAELRQAEAERARLAAIVTSSEDAIIGKTLDGIITSWNPGAERLFGYPADEAIGQPMLMVFPPEYREEEAHLLACVRRGEAVPAFDTVRMRRDGTHVPVAVSLSPIHDGSGQIVGVSKIARDITGRVALEAARQADQLRLEELVVARTEALAEKERHLQSILDGMPGMVAYWDANECLQFANRLHHLKHGYRDALGVSMAELLGPLAYAHARPHVEAVLQGEVRSFEASLGTLPEGGLDDMVQINFVPDVVKDQVQGFIVMIFDISPMKKAEAAAEAASRAKSEFLANMSHEIRTPLNAVLGLAQVAQRRHASEPVADTLTMIVQAGQHLLGVINDVLDFSKIEAGKLDLQIGCVDVSEWLGKAVSMVADQARDKGLSLRVSRDPALAPAYAGDAVRLAQILINLLTNAVKFTEKGQVELVVRSDGDGLSLVVSDSGIGMSESVMARLFSPFEQGDGSTTRRFGGTGLGLSICKRLVALMKGRISVSSEPGVGSRFDIWLPLQPLVSQAVDVNQPGRGAPLSWAMPPSGERLKGLRLLVAEDHPVNQMVLAQLLEMEGAELVMVAHGGLAVEQVHEQGADAFNLVLCDIEMPVMDGYEATRQIKALASGLPVVGLTAHAFEDARLRGAEAGMVDYVTKPYMVDTLVLAILRHAVGVVLQPAPVAVKTPSVSVGPYGIDRQALALHYRTLPDFVPRLLSMVRQTCESQPALLQAALDGAQPERLRYLAHGVAGMAANLLMPELRALAHKLEQASERSLQEAAPLVAELKDALATLCGHLDAS